MKISAELKELSNIFYENKKSLYIVGGYVRDSYLGIQSLIRDDIDLCSNVTPKQLRKMLEDTDFVVNPKNEKFGVMEIVGKRSYEFATFRKEIYEDESHNPSSIEFINSLEEDARRRDFKINAIYYDIHNGTFIDPLGGLEDLKDKVITTVKVPKIVFNDDPERILRLIRFACSMGLNIPEEEWFYAKQNAFKVKYMSKFRLKNEFEKLLTADQIYPELLYTKDAHFRAMLLIGELGIWKDILPGMEDIQNTEVRDKKGERIYEHVLNCIKNSSPKIRLAVLLHDSAKVKTIEEKRSMFGSKEFVNVIVEKNLGINGLGYPKNIVENVIRTVLGYDFNRFGLASKKSIKQFIFRNRPVIENIIEIKTVVYNESSGYGKKSKSAENLRNIYNQMLKENTPFELRDLKINGDDIIKNFPNINIENIDVLLESILEWAVLNPKKNNKKELLLVATKMINSKRGFYLD
ncbi:MAG: CCA tRNA nucleotidyltransferase [Clostridia bacterium]|nr:CCA tRNA nucleotidyltransferase [Clostridia bacterium]